MTASAASSILRRSGLWPAACGVLLAAVLLPGCALKREYVRRGELLDSLAVRVHRLEAGQEAVRDDLSELRAEVLTQLEQQLDRLDQLDARFDETGDRLERIGLKLGMGRGNLTPQPAPPDTARPASQPDTAAAVVVGDSGPDPKAMYDVAYYDFTRGKFEVAIDGFEDFLKRFPESDNADNARYWVGECYYSMGQLERAETEFGRVLSEYPDGNKVPSAAYKLGMVKLAAGRAEDARARFRQVVEKYPGTNEARLAADRLQSMED